MKAPGPIHAGTSGYSYKEWRGTFYPDKLAPAKFLEFYAGRFSTVEINNTFYRFPTPEVLEQWAAQTSDEFTFAVKANQRITHRSRLKNVEEVTSSFVERCRLLGDRLGSILFQLPPQLKRDDERLTAFLETLPEDGRYAIEFRDESWFEEPVFKQLRDSGVALVQSEDEKIQAPRVVTADFCYVRLRRSDYDETRLRDWHAWIKEQRQEGRVVFVYLKHDDKGTSPETALRLLEGG